MNRPGFRPESWELPSAEAVADPGGTGPTAAPTQPITMLNSLQYMPADVRAQIHHALRELLETPGYGQNSVDYAGYLELCETVRASGEDEGVAD